MAEEVKIIKNVSSGYFSIARHYGGCTFQDKEFVYIPTEDALIRKDLIKQFNKAKKHGISFEAFIESIQ